MTKQNFKWANQTQKNRLMGLLRRKDAQPRITQNNLSKSAKQLQKTDQIQIKINPSALVKFNKKYLFKVFVLIISHTFVVYFLLATLKIFGFLRTARLLSLFYGVFKKREERERERKRERAL